MIAAKVQFSIVTYNALIDACARSQDMARVGPLLEEMHRNDIEPNTITYSTVVKGYCQENNIEKAFELFREMKQSPSFRPDEITYNTLLDGCARHGMWEQGIGLVEDMQKVGVNPSNFTLSVLVKLANRSKHPQLAFDMCDELCKKYHIRPNVHVYNNLVHVCIVHWTTEKALEIFEQMLSERVRPDTRSYTLLIRSFLGAGEAQDAAGLLCAAVGMKERHCRLQRFDTSLLRAQGGLSPDFIAETLEAITWKCGDESLAMHLLRDLRKLPGMKLDSKVQQRITSQALR